ARAVCRHPCPATDTDPPAIYTLSLHDALPICMMHDLEQIREQGGEIVYGGNRLDRPGYFVEPVIVRARPDMPIVAQETFAPILRSQEHTSELQSRENLVCRLLLEKKNATPLSA